MLWWQPEGRDAHERLGHEACEDAVLAGDLRADLPIGRQAIRVSENVVERPVELELARGVLVIALDHVESHGAAIVDHLHVDRSEAFELIDVVAIGLREAISRFSVLVELKPHHLGFGAHAKLQPVVLFLELFVQPAKIATAVRCQIATRVLALLAVSKQRAIESADALFPGQLHEGFRFGNADQFRCLRAVSEVSTCTVGEKIDGRAIDQLKSFLSNGFPMIRRDPLAHDLSGDRHELQVQIVDSAFINQLPDLLDLVGPARCIYKSLQISGHFIPPCKPEFPGTAHVAPSSSQFCIAMESGRGP